MTSPVLYSKTLEHGICASMSSSGSWDEPAPICSSSRLPIVDRRESSPDQAEPRSSDLCRGLEAGDPPRRYYKAVEMPRRNGRLAWLQNHNTDMIVFSSNVIRDTSCHAGPEPSIQNRGISRQNRDIKG